MKVRLYCAFDKTANKSLCVFSDVNDGMAIRNNVIALSKVVPLGDLELRFLGCFDDVDMSINPLGKDYVVIDWNSYKFPESPIKKEGAKDE